MAIMVETMANQFTDKDSLILRTDTSEMIEDESVEIVKQIEDQTRGSVKTARKLSDITSKGSPTNIWHPEKNTFFIFNKHPVQESLKTLQEVLPLRNDCAWFSCLYINCQAHETWKSESHIITVSKWVLRQKWNADVYVALHSRNTIARRHGHVFRMALHNEGDWRMETWQRARRASCQVSIRQSPSCVMPFWTHAKCLLAFISYLLMWIKAKYTFIKTVYSPRFYGGPYLQAKHADVCSGVLFWTACTRRPHVLSLPSSSGCEKSDSWRQARSVKTARKSHEWYHNVVMWHWIVYKWRRSNKMLSFRRTFFNLLDFTVSLSYRDWHSETPWSHSSNQPGGTYCQAQDFLLCTNYTLEMWCANTKSANQVPTSPVKTLVIPMSWSYRYFEWQKR